MEMRQQGFTLLETLVALTLMGLLMVALFGGFRAGLASWQVAERQVAASEPQLMLERMLYRHLSQLRYAVVSRERTRSNWSATGKAAFYLAGPEVLRYTAPLAQAVGGDLYLIELHSQPDGREGVWIRMVPFVEGEHEQALEALDNEELQQVSDRLRIRFSYFLDSQAEEDAETEWLDELEQGAIPSLVRVHWTAEERVWASTTYQIVAS